MKSECPTEDELFEYFEDLSQAVADATQKPAARSRLDGGKSRRGGEHPEALP